MWLFAKADMRWKHWRQNRLLGSLFGSWLFNTEDKHFFIQSIETIAFHNTSKKAVSLGGLLLLLTKMLPRTSIVLIVQTEHVSWQNYALLFSFSSLQNTSVMLRSLTHAHLN